MAERHWIGAAGANWSVTTNWSATAGGASVGAIPTTADDVFFDVDVNTSCVLNTSTAKVGKSLTIGTGYTGTLTFNVNLTLSGVGGNITLSSGVQWVGSGSLLLTGSGTITSNGNTIGVNFGVRGAYTLADNGATSKILTISSSSAAALNKTTAETFTTSGGLTIGQTGTGTATIILTGGSVDSDGTSNSCKQPISIEGNITLAASFNMANTITWVSGTITDGGFYFYASGGSVWKMGGVTLQTFAINGSVTFTLEEDLHVVVFRGPPSSSQTAVINQTTNERLCISGTVGATPATVTISGTAPIYFETGCNWSVTAPLVASNIYINGNCTINGLIMTTGTIHYVTGTVTTAVMTMSGSGGFDTAGMTWASVTFSGTATRTVTVTGLVATAMVLPNASIVFAGTAGWTVGTLTNTSLSTARQVTLTEALEYKINTSWAANTDLGYTSYLWTSAHASTKAKLTLAYGATQAVVAVYATRIDSSLGQAILTVGGTITTCFNWVTSVASATVIGTGGQSLTVAGITKDKDGVALGSCDCYLFRDNGNNTSTYLQHQQSNAVTGAYSFTVYAGSTYFVVAFKSGATPLMDVTYRTLTAV